ncbi:MAG: DNA polymerase III subunit gamma/tau [Rhodothermales bacterium]
MIPVSPNALRSVALTPMADQRYLVTARKYRPQRFDELVSQEHVSGTLKNALRMDRLAHAYLFSGPRGVGKTTAARILAKAINCTTAPADRTDQAEPCRECESCRSFEEGRSLNIIEIDAASNNKVEDIRDLRETVRVPPQGSKKKVYIVDEVHMLSNSAFNALLKTLEEPPPYVLFIFATTEPHKVLPTILSRCQRFDFRRIPVPQIIERLVGITAQEGITADEASLMLIARKGDGALRDALSAFDQAVSLCGTDLRYAELAQAMGVVDIDMFFNLTAQVRARSAAGMLALVDRVVREGLDLQELLVGLSEHLRNLMVARTMPDTSLIEAAAATQERYANEASDFTESDVLRLMMVAAETEEAIKNSTQPRLKLELGLLKMVALTQGVELQSALDRLARIEAEVQSGTVTVAMPAQSRPSAGAPPVPPAGAPNVAETPPLPTGINTAPVAKASTTPVSEPPVLAAQPKPTSSELDPTLDERPREEADESPTQLDEDEAFAAPSLKAEQELTPPPPKSDPAPVSLSTEAPSGGSTRGLFGPPALKRKPRLGGPKAALGGDGQASVVPDQTDVAVAEAADERPAAPMPAVAPALWQAAVDGIRVERIHVGSLLQNVRLVGLSRGSLRLAVPDTFHQRMLSTQHDYLVAKFKDTLNLDLERLQFSVEATAEYQANISDHKRLDPATYMQQLREQDPTVQALFDLFGGEIVY